MAWNTSYRSVSVGRIALDRREAGGELVADAEVVHRITNARLDMIEVEHALADEHRLDHPEVFAGDKRVAEGFANPLHALVGLDLDQAAVAAVAAAARHAVGLFRREHVFKADKRQTPDAGHGRILK